MNTILLPYEFDEINHTIDQILNHARSKIVSKWYAGIHSQEKDREVEVERIHHQNRNDHPYIDAKSIRVWKVNNVKIAKRITDRLRAKHIDICYCEDKHVNNRDVFVYVFCKGEHV